MPQRAFISKIDLPNGTDPQNVVDIILDALEDAGFTVLSVAPWKSQDEIATDLSSLLEGQSSLTNQDLTVPDIKPLGEP